MGLRSRLFAVSLLLLSLFGLASGPWLHRNLETLLTERIEGELLRQARMAARSLEAFGQQVPEREIALWALDTGAQIQTRITIIAGDGRVIAASNLPLADYPRIDDHSDRPEVIQARLEGMGMARRHSVTVAVDMLYLAVPVDLPEHAPATLRVSLPLADVDDALEALRWLLLLAAALGVLIAGGMTALASNLLTRDLRQLLARVEELAESPDAGDRWTFQGLTAELDARVQALADERHTVATVLGSMEEGVLGVDGEGRVDLCNPAARERLELPHDVEGGPLPRDTRLAPLLRVIDEATGGRSAAAEFTLYEAAPQAGQIRPPTIVHATAAPRSSGGAVVVLLDVTRLRKLETVRQDFVANVSHELRTPLSVIQANTEALQGGALDEPEVAARFLGHIHRTTERLGNLVADLLSLSRIEAGGGVNEPEAVSLDGQVPTWLAAVEHRAEARSQVVVSAVLPGLVVQADTDALHQVMLNLLENALKYSPEGSRVALHGQRRGERVRLEVHDEGPGVALALRPRLFERFYRVDPGRSRDMGGTGLGLAIVKHLVEAMHGRVGMVGREPEGSIFWVELPAG